MTFVETTSMLVRVDPPARYRLGQYLRAALRDPDDRDAWIDEAAAEDLYALWQELDTESGD